MIQAADLPRLSRADAHSIKQLWTCGHEPGTRAIAADYYEQSGNLAAAKYLRTAPSLRVQCFIEIMDLLSSECYSVSIYNIWRRKLYGQTTIRRTLEAMCACGVLVKLAAWGKRPAFYRPIERA